MNTDKSGILHDDYTSTESEKVLYNRQEGLTLETMKLTIDDGFCAFTPPGRTSDVSSRLGL